MIDTNNRVAQGVTLAVRQYHCKLCCVCHTAADPSAVWDLVYSFSLTLHFSSLPHIQTALKWCNDRQKQDLALRALTKLDYIQPNKRRTLFFFFFPLTHFSCHINKDIPHLFDRIFPESLRWLLATQQYGRSKWIMGHIVEKNQVNVELDPENILAGNESFNSNLKISDCILHFDMFCATYCFPAKVSARPLFWMVWSALLFPALLIQMRQIDKVIYISHLANTEIIHYKGSIGCWTLDYGTLKCSLISL